MATIEPFEASRRSAEVYFGIWEEGNDYGTKTTSASQQKSTVSCDLGQIRERITPEKISLVFYPRPNQQFLFLYLFAVFELYE